MAERDQIKAVFQQRHAIVRIVKDAYKKGYSARVKAGKIQFVIVAYDAKGKSTVTPITEYLTAEEADKFMEGL